MLNEDGPWRVNPISPLVHAARSVPVWLGLVFVGASAVGYVWGPLTILLSVFIIVTLAGIVALFQFVNWQRLTFWFDDQGDFRVDSGVLTRQQRRIQLSRVQAVDVVQPLVARLFSMAEITIEVAGTGESRVRLSFLTHNEAHLLRETILTRARGAAPDGSTAARPDEVTVLSRVPWPTLAVSLLLRTSTAGLLILTAVILAIAIRREGWSGLGLALITGGVPILTVFAEFIRYYGFTVSEAEDGLRLRFGLLKTEHRTIPAGRVQAIEIVEPLLWRRKDWVRVRVNIAGVGKASDSSSSSNGGETLLTPVATRMEALALVSRLMPSLNFESMEWHSAPRRAWRRSPVQYPMLAIGWTDSFFTARRGRINRRTAVIPIARAQSVRWTQGAWERALNLASVHVDSTPGPVRISGLHLDAEFAKTVAGEQAERCAAQVR
jgi:putative membrane protein